MRFLYASVVVALAFPTVQAADNSLEAALREKAPSIIAELKKKGHQYVGVLKFLVQVGQDRTSDDVGGLNRSLANMMEVALVLGLTPKDNLGIVHNPSEMVIKEKMTRANHLTEDGRKAFFERKFPLAWTQELVEPSGFLTGRAIFSDDLKQMVVSFQLFDRTGMLADIPGEITVPSDPESLAEAGFSYTLPVSHRQALVSGDPPRQEVLQSEAVRQIVAATDSRSAIKPSAPLAECPIKWTIEYNGKPIDGAGTTIPEPAEGDRITFTLKNPGSETYGVVLMVNGVNTLYEERAAPLACRKWVLGKGEEVPVRGFQVAQNKVLPFVVTPLEAASPDVVRYGDHAGTFRLVVFAGQIQSTPARPEADMLVRADRDENVIGMTRGAGRPSGARPVSTLAEYQALLRGRVKPSEFGRGYVGKGTKSEENDTTLVRFVPSATVPVSDISIRYLRLKK